MSWHFNFAVQPKYCILRHFSFTVWPKYHNFQNFNFAIVLQIEFFISMSFQYFRSFGKSKEPKSKLKYIFFFFCTPFIHKSTKNSRKTRFWFEDIIIFIIWVYNWIYISYDLRSLLPWKLTYIALCKIFPF